MNWQALFSNQKLWTGVGMIGLCLYHALVKQDADSAVHDFLFALAAWGLGNIPTKPSPGNGSGSQAGQGSRVVVLLGVLLLLPLGAAGRVSACPCGPACACGPSCPCAEIQARIAELQQDPEGHPRFAQMAIDAYRAKLATFG